MSRVRISLLWSFAQRYLGLAIGLVSTVVLARLLTPAQIGVFSLCAALVSVGSAVRDFGVGEYLVQEKDLTPAKMKGAFAVAIVMAWGVAALLFALQGLVAHYYAEPGVGEILRVLCLNMLLLPLVSPAMALLHREMAFRQLFVVQTGSAAVHATTSIVLAGLGQGFMSLAWANVASTVALILLVSWYRPRQSWLLPSFRQARPIWSYGLMFSGTGVLNSISGNVHELVIGRQFGFTALGLFSRAVGLVDQFYGNLSAAIQRVATPALAAEHRAGAELRALYARSVAIFTSMAWPFLGFVAWMAPQLIDVLLGPQWQAAVPLAATVAVGSMFMALWALAPNLLSATGHVKRRLQTAAVAAPIQIVAVVAASFFSLQAVALALAAVWVSKLTLYSFHVQAVIGFGPLDLGRAVWPSFLLAVPTWAALALAAAAAQALGGAAWVQLVMAAAAAVLVWLVCLWGSGHATAVELRRAVANWRLFCQDEGARVKGTAETDRK